MKTLIFLTLPVMLLAAGEAIPSGAIDPLARLGAVSVLGFVVIWHTTRTFPAISKMHREDSEKWRQTLDHVADSCQRAVDRLDKRT